MLSPHVNPYYFYFFYIFIFYIFEKFIKTWVKNWVATDAPSLQCLRSKTPQSFA
jgi:hypothetical protein